MPEAGLLRRVVDLKPGVGAAAVAPGVVGARPLPAHLSGARADRAALRDHVIAGPRRPCDEQRARHREQQGEQEGSGAHGTAAGAGVLWQWLAAHGAHFAQCSNPNWLGPLGGSGRSGGAGAAGSSGSLGVGGLGEGWLGGDGGLGAGGGGAGGGARARMPARALGAQRGPRERERARVAGRRGLPSAGSADAATARARGHGVVQGIAARDRPGAVRCGLARPRPARSVAPARRRRHRRPRR